MDEINQPVASGFSSASKTTRALVVVYHFFVAAIIGGALVLDWLPGTPSTRDDRFILKAMSLIATPVVLLYLVTAWGILRWKNWSRSVALVLNWINVIAAALNIALNRMETKGLISVLLSCLVLWWLSIPAIKLEFRHGNLAR